MASRTLVSCAWCRCCRRPTEIVYALGLGDQLVGVTFECDEPASARAEKTIVVGGLDTRGMTPREIDDYVRGQLAALAHAHVLVYMLAIPAIVPATFAAISVAGEWQQGSLEPVLTTPIRREEFLLGKALAALVPAISVSYGVFGVFVAAIELFARPAVTSAVLRGPELVAQVLFTPLLAALSSWIGIAISARSNDPRVAAQLSVLASLPSILVTTLIAIGKIHVTLGLALSFEAALLLLDALGWRIVSPAFDRERLITGTR